MSRTPVQIEDKFCRIRKEILPFFVLAIDCSGKKTQGKFCRYFQNKRKVSPRFWERFIIACKASNVLIMQRFLLSGTFSQR